MVVRNFNKGLIMNYLRNHCWCSDSNWGGNFDCQIIVSLNHYESDAYKEDWNNLMYKKTGIATLEFGKHAGMEYETEYYSLKPEVIQWLVENIPDFQKGKGWCIGSEKYMMTDSGSASVFFQRRRDAMKFIKTWSKWKRPLFYCQYFTDIRKQLDLSTGKYVDVS